MKPITCALLTVALLTTSAAIADNSRVPPLKHTGSPEVDHLMRLLGNASEVCTDGDVDEATMDAACKAGDRIYRQIEARGFCKRGPRPDSPLAEWRWMRCKV